MYTNKQMRQVDVLEKVVNEVPTNEIINNFTILLIQDAASNFIRSIPSIFQTYLRLNSSFHIFVMINNLIQSDIEVMSFRRG